MKPDGHITKLVEIILVTFLLPQSQLIVEPDLVQSRTRTEFYFDTK